MSACLRACMQDERPQLSVCPCPFLCHTHSTAGIAHNEQVPTANVWPWVQVNGGEGEGACSCGSWRLHKPALQRLPRLLRLLRRRRWMASSSSAARPTAAGAPCAPPWAVAR